MAHIKLRQVEEMLDQAIGQNKQVTYSVASKSHYHITIQCNGERRLIIQSKTPSDVRGVLNFKSHIRRIVRELTANDRD